MSETSETKGRHGGPGRGQGLKPIFEQAMGKVTTRLPTSMKAWLDDTGNASGVLRALLEWAMEHQDDLVDDPGSAGAEETVRTTYTLSNDHVAMAAQLGSGSYVAGVRRVVGTARQIDFVPDSSD